MTRGLRDQIKMEAIAAKITTNNFVIELLRKGLPINVVVTLQKDKPKHLVVNVSTEKPTARQKGGQ
jgi:hypothetical protein